VLGSGALDEELMKKHFDEAERNKLLNAQLYKESQKAFNNNLHDKLEQAHDDIQDEEKSKHSIAIHNIRLIVFLV
jgi:hypothetical protein